MNFGKSLHAGVRILHGNGDVSPEMPGMESKWNEETRVRRFILSRSEDLSGISGTGDVAEGVVFTDGTTVLRWTVELTSTAIYDSISDVILIHGHDGKTTVRWVDG